VKLGRRRPTHRAKIRLGKYLDIAALPTPPDAVDYSPAATAALAQKYLNDQLGDCVIAGSCHLRGVTSANAGGPCAIFPQDQIIALYSAIGGYNGTPQSDQGCDELTALGYLSSQGYPDGVRLVGYAGVDATNVAEVRAAVWLFENVVFGVELPDAWMSPSPSASGFVWDVAGDPDPNNGHCVVGVGYTEQGVLISTWGMIGLLTWAAVAKYAVPAAGGELHVALSPDSVTRATGRAPAGFDLPTLQADLAAFSAAVAPTLPAAHQTLLEEFEADALALLAKIRAALGKL
jgi:hypothetical protein